MDKKNLVAAQATIETFAEDLVAKASDIADRQHKAFEAFRAEWDQLHESIPEGRLQRLPESAAVKSSQQTAASNEQAALHEVLRFKHLSGVGAPGNLPAHTPLLPA